MIRTVSAVALLSAVIAAPSLAAAQASSERPPQRIRSVTLQPGQKCPPSTSDEVVVCGTVAEPYRIPSVLRDSGPIPVKNQSWANRAADITDVSRRAAGLPNTCSPIGTGGATGCAQQAANAYARDRRAGVDGASQVP